MIIPTTGLRFEWIKGERSLIHRSLVHRSLITFITLLSSFEYRLREGRLQKQRTGTETEQRQNRDRTETETGTEDPDAPNEREEGWGYYQDSDFYLEESHTSIIRQILFLQEEEPGVVAGFNLDGRVSEDDDEVTCGHSDLEDPEGRGGIDNQFATLFRLLSVIVEDTPQVAIQGAINEGRVLMMVELLGVDSLQN